MEDKKIISLFEARSEDAIRETKEKYGRYCRYIAYQILQNDEDAGEAVNDTMLSLWEHIPPFKPDPLKGYIATVCANIAKNQAERNSAQKRGGGSVPMLLDELSECVAGERGEFADELALKDALERFLKSLPKKKCRLFLQRYYYGLSVEELAAECGLRPNRISVELLRLRAQLKDHLEKEGFMV